MPSNFDINAFYDRVRDAPRRVLMLDYDGTLAPFHIDPARAMPYPGVIPLLNRIMDCRGSRLIIISGRWIQNLVPLLGLDRLPELWGSHGWERRQANGAYAAAEIGSEELDLIAAAHTWLPAIESLGARIERKPACLAIHWRGLPAAAAHGIKARVFDAGGHLPHGGKVAWHEFDGGIELRVAGYDKGSVVREILTEEGPAAAYAYLGDDDTDEAAFAAMPDHGATVLVRQHYRTTAARHWIRPPSGLRRFLMHWLDAVRG